MRRRHPSPRHLVLAGLVGLLTTLAPATASAVTQAIPAAVNANAWTVAGALPPAGPTTNFTFGPSNQLSVMGDWNGDGLRTPGYADNGVIKVNNSLPPGGSTISVTFGSKLGFPAVGDFNGDGRDDIAMYTNGQWEIRMQAGGIGSGGAVTTRTFSFGSGSYPFVWPVAGNWDGTGPDGIGTYNILTGTWQLRQTAEAAGANLAPFAYRPMGLMLPVVGDWNADGTDSVGGKSASTWFLNNENDASATDITFTFGGSAFGVVGGKFADATPKAVNDAATVAEDANATTVNVLGNDTDVDGGPKSVQSVTQPANGTVAITGGGTGLTYKPNPNYCNDPPGTTPDTFTYTLTPGGSVATVSITVTCVDDAPVAVTDSATVIQDTGANAIPVLGNDTDVDGGPKSVQSVTQPANGIVAITGGGTGLSYAPDADYCNDPPGTTPDTFTYTLAPGSSSATVSITVTCTDDAPVAVGDGETVGEDAAASAVDVLANDTDTDGGPISVASVTQPANGTVAITGGGTGLSYAPDADYCNSPPGTTPDTFTYTLAPGSSSATVSITVTCTDDPPVAVGDGETVGEDAAASAVDVLANDTDIDGGPKSVASVTQPDNGTVVTNGTDVSYAPDADYCNDPPGTTPDTFTYTLNGGSTATVSMTVTCVDDAPVAVDDSETATEDSGATAVGVLGNDTDIDGGPKSIDTVTQPANGTVAITGGGTGLTYEPSANFCSDPPGTTPDTFTYTLTPGSSTGTVSMTVSCVDDPPVAVGDSETVGQNTSSNAIDVLANDTDIDGGPKSVASVTQPDNGTVANNGTDVSYTPDADFCNDPPGTTPDTFTYALTPGGSTATVSVSVLCDVPPTAVDDSATVDEDSGATAITVLPNDTDPDGGPKSVASVTQPDHGTAAVSGGGTGVQYTPDGNYCNTGGPPAPDTFTYTLAPGGSSATVSMTVTCVDDPPVAVNDDHSVFEDSGATLIFVLPNDTDVDGGPKTIASVTQPDNGTASNNGTDVTYTPDANYCNNPPGGAPDTFTYALTPGGSSATVSVTVNCAADPPDVATSAGVLAYAENDAATAIDAGLTVTDPDPGAMITGATVAITGNFAGAQDVLALTGLHAPITAGPQIGSTLTLGGTATPAAYQAALRDVTYANTSEGPSTLARTVTFTVTDNTALSDSATRAITIDGVNDPPTAVDDAIGVTDEDTPFSVPAPGVLANDTDADPGDTKTVVALNGTGTLTQTLPSGASVTINANGSLTYNPLAAFQGLSSGQSASDSFTYTMRDAANAQSTATVSITITGVNDAPTAGTDTFNGASAAVGNTALVVNAPGDGPQSVAGAKKSITGNVLANDADPDGPDALAIVAGTFTSSDGGSVVIESDGDFTFTPKAGTSCSDTSDAFTYTISDGNTPTPGAAVGTVNISIAGCVWYVSNNAAGDSGTSTAPFDRLGQAQTASATGDTIYVYDGDNSPTGYSAGVVLKTNQRLLGEAATLQIGADVLQTGTPANRPTVTNTHVENPGPGDVVKLASGNTVRGLDINPEPTGGGIAGAGITGGTIDDVRIIDTGTAGNEPGLDLDTTSGTFNISDLTINSSAATSATSGSIGVRLNNAGIVNFTASGTISITTKGAKGLDAADTNLGASEFDDITVTGSGTGAVRMVTTDGTTSLGNGGGTDLSLQTTSGSEAAFRLSNAGSVTVPAGGTSNVSASGGPAVDVTGTSGANLRFDTVASSNSNSDGVNLAGLGAGVFSADSSSVIAGADDFGFDLDGGSGAITYDGTITDDVGQLVRVQNTTGGTKDFNGAISDGGDGDGSGIALTSNTGATIRFDGGLTLSTGAIPAFAATGGGSVAVTDPAGATNNTIATTTGTALNVTSTSIHNDDLTFERISSNGAATGIVLNTTTNAQGRLFVTGNGGTCSSAANCSGGAIQGSTGAGISLTSVPGGASLTRVAVTGGGDDGIRATTVGTGVALDSSVVSANGNAVGENGLDYAGVTGTSTVNATTVTGSGEHNAFINSTTGTHNIDVIGSTFSLNSNAVGGDGLSVTTSGDSTTVNADVTGSTFSQNRDAGFRLTTGAGSPTQNVNFINNDVFGGHPGAVPGSPGVVFAAGGGTDVRARIENNDIIDSRGSALILNPIPNSTDAASFDAIVDNNRIGDNDANSGSDEGIALWVQANGSGDSKFSITNNTIKHWQQNAMRVQSGEKITADPATNQPGTAHVTITGNAASNPDPSSVDTISLIAGVQSAAAAQDVCFDIGGAGALSNAFGGQAGAGSADLKVSERFAAMLWFPGFAGDGADQSVIQTFVRARNAGNPTVTLVDNAISGGAVCSQPTPPPAVTP